MSEGISDLPANTKFELSFDSHGSLGSELIFAEEFIVHILNSFENRRALTFKLHAPDRIYSCLVRVHTGFSAEGSGCTFEAIIFDNDRLPRKAYVLIKDALGSGTCRLA